MMSIVPSSERRVLYAFDEKPSSEAPRILWPRSEQAAAYARCSPMIWSLISGVAVDQNPSSPYRSTIHVAVIVALLRVSSGSSLLCPAWVMTREGLARSSPGRQLRDCPSQL